MKTIDLDALVLAYQETNQSEELVNKFHNFLNKYAQLLKSDAIDFSNYDVRCFLRCFIQDKELRKSLYKGKKLTTEVVEVARKAVDYLQFKLRNHTEQDIYAELVIPFLQCAKRYRQRGRSFEKYLYRSYRFYLKRHLDRTLRLDGIDQNGILYYSQFSADIETGEGKEERENLLAPDLEAGMELTDPRWITGKDCHPVFQSLKPHERYILAKYYYEHHTDREIARMLPYNPKSIHRIRMRMKLHFQKLYQQGELKWIRI